MAPDGQEPHRGGEYGADRYGVDAGQQAGHRQHAADRRGRERHHACDPQGFVGSLLAAQEAEHHAGDHGQQRVPRDPGVISGRAEEGRDAVRLGEMLNCEAGLERV
jgi:hypothetical protein